MPRLTVPVAGREYRIVDAPEALEGGADFQVDHIEHLLWLAPGIVGPLRDSAIGLAVALAWQEVALLIPVLL